MSDCHDIDAGIAGIQAMKETNPAEFKECVAVPVEPNDAELADRLAVLADAVTRRDWSEFTMRVPADHWRDADLVLSDASRRLRAKAAAPQNPREGELARLECEWSFEADWDAESWQGSCGAIWEFMADGPEENEMHFCPKCGGKVRLKAEVRDE